MVSEKSGSTRQFMRGGEDKKSGAWIEAKMSGFRSAAPNYNAAHRKVRLRRHDMGLGQLWPILLVMGAVVGIVVPFMVD